MKRNAEKNIFHNKIRPVYNLPYQDKTIFTIYY